MEARLWFSHCRSCSSSTARVAMALVHKSHIFTLFVVYCMILTAAVCARAGCLDDNNELVRMYTEVIVAYFEELFPASACRDKEKPIRGVLTRLSGPRSRPIISHKIW
jgi:hypothetical protein